MNYSNYRFNLDVQSTVSQVSLPVRLLDTGRRLYIGLTDGGTPYIIEDGCRAVFYAKKADGKTIMNDCIIERGAIIRYDLSKQTTACAGVVDCEVRLYGTENNLITSPRFIMVVNERVVHDDDIPLSESEQSVLDNILLTETARENAEKLRVDAEAERDATFANLAEEVTEAVGRANEAADSAVATANQAAQNAVQIATEAGERANATAQSANSTAQIATMTAESALAKASSHTHDYIPTSQRGVANGVAGLDAGGKVPSSQLPSYVDDVLEYASRSAFPSSGEGGKIYVDTSTGISWRWSGSTYTEITSPEHTHTKSEITDFPTTFPPSTHFHGASEIVPGVFGRGGPVLANSSEQPPLSFCLRNSCISPGGTTPSNNGELVWFYE